MLFRTFDPYYDDITKLYDIEDCFICYQVIIDDDEIKPIKLNNQIFYLKKCNCNGNIHMKCLDIWFTMHNTCPVCRSIIQKNYKINDSSFILFYKYFMIIKQFYVFIFYIYVAFEVYKIKISSTYYN
jgi:hypothetical protein